MWQEDPPQTIEELAKLQVKINKAEKTKARQAAKQEKESDVKIDEVATASSEGQGTSLGGLGVKD